MGVFKVLMPFVKCYWFVRRPKVTGVKCIVKNGDDILMVRHTYGKSLWTFPGGGVKKGEGLTEAVRREIKEEVGFDMKDLTQVGHFYATDQYVRDNVFVFTGQTDRRDFKLDKLEILDAGWFGWDNLPPLSGYAKKALSFIGVKTDWQK